VRFYSYVNLCLSFFFNHFSVVYNVVCVCVCFMPRNVFLTSKCTKMRVGSLQRSSKSRSQIKQRDMEEREWKERDEVERLEGYIYVTIETQDK